jgi:hypothetical protein
MYIIEVQLIEFYSLTNPNKIVFDDVNWIYLAQDMIQGGSTVKAAIIFVLHKSKEIFGLHIHS